MRRPALLLTVFSMLMTTARAVEPHRSASALPSSNGRAAVSFNVATQRLDTLLEHPYRYPRAGAQSRDFLYDLYPGIRIGPAGTPGSWLPSINASTLEYLNGTGIIHVQRSTGGLVLDEYEFAPIGLAENAVLVLLKVKRVSAGDDVSAFFLANLHLGAGSPDPSSDGEGIQYNAGQDAYYEYGDSGVAFGYGSILPSTGRTAGPRNPYDELLAGRDFVTDLGPTNGNDLVGGFQSHLGSLAVGQEAWAGWYVVFAPDADAASAVARVKTWLAGRSPSSILDAEVADWNAWITPPPTGASEQETAVARQAQAFVRMAQVREDGKAHGQVLASLPPGQWNIAWVRDMAYATAALARTGHLNEARDAIAFQLGASAGTLADKVGQPYLLSVCRYYGNGDEESDVNENGPNVEFDGFGLFLWELDTYLSSGGDASLVAQWWPRVKAGVADVLLGLQGADGTIAPDSSIWEVHWNGQQKHFAYTTITAARGFSAAAHLATVLNDPDAAKYAAAATRARDALALMRDPNGTLAQSTEALGNPATMLDAAVLEAIDFGLVDPSGTTAARTLAQLGSKLVPASGRGLFRNQDGGWYDSQEWVFIDLRYARALELAKQDAASAALFSWNTDQASANFNILSELHDASTADYAGAAPMVGFGAGAYLLRLDERGKPTPPLGGSYLAEPVPPPVVELTPAQAEVAVGQPVKLHVKVTSQDSITSVDWSLAQNAPHPIYLIDGESTFSVPLTGVGTYTVHVTARDAHGRSGSADARITIFDPPPTIAMGPLSSAKVNELVTITASATDTPSDTAAGFHWTIDFGDDTPTVGLDGVTRIAQPHRYLKTGTFKVTVTATDQNGHETSSSIEVHVSAAGCGCASDSLAPAWLLGLLLLLRRRVRPLC